MTNKIVYIAGGASVASLAVGGAAGYFIAVKKQTAEFEERLENELAAAKTYYTQLLAEAYRENDDDVTEEEEEDEEPDPAVYDPQQPDEEEEEDEELSEADQKVVERAGRALVNYQGYHKPDLATVGVIEEHNIFEGATTPKKKLPPREPGTGKFIPKQHETPQNEHGEGEPELITADDFLVNDSEYEQENLLYFVNDDTLIQVYDNEVVENVRVGQNNLKNFPPADGDEPRVIFVRNHGLKIDYEIIYTENSLTEHMGLSES